MKWRGCQITWCTTFRYDLAGCITGRSITQAAAQLHNRATVVQPHGTYIFKGSCGHMTIASSQVTGHVSIWAFGLCLMGDMFQWAHGDYSSELSMWQGLKWLKQCQMVNTVLGNEGPSITVEEDNVKWLLSLGFSRSAVADILWISRRTPYNKIAAFSNPEEFNKTSLIVHRNNAILSQCKHWPGCRRWLQK